MGTQTIQRDSWKTWTDLRKERLTNETEVYTEEGLEKDKDRKCESDQDT